MVQLPTRRGTQGLFVPKENIGIDLVTDESDVMLLAELDNDVHVVFAIHAASRIGWAIDEHNARHSIVLQGLVIRIMKRLFMLDHQD